MQSHYLFEDRFGRPGKGNDKGKVEGLVGYLLRLAELELIERERRMVERRIKEARFPAVKSLDSFNFTALPSLNRTLVLEPARSEYVLRRENVIAVGNSGTGKSHVALGLGFTELHEKATTAVAREFLLHLIAAVPYKIHTVLTDNGLHFTDPRGTSWTAAEIKELIARKEPFRAHAVEYTCATTDIDHRLTKPKHPWTNGQVERLNRTIKDATVKRFHYENHDQLRSHLADFVTAYNLARRLRTLKGLTPYGYICKLWTKEPDRFTLDPLHKMPGLNMWAGGGNP